MSILTEQRALDQVCARLEQHLGVPRGQARRLAARAAGPDAVVRVGPVRFVVEWKPAGDPASARRAVELLREGADAGLPLLAVPYLSEAGRRICEEAGINWLDLSGNAFIRSDRLLIRVEGRPDLFPRPGRPASAFAPVSARLVRWLLVHPDDRVTQSRLASAADVDPGLASRVIRRLVADGLLARDDDDSIVVPDAALLLDAWREHYRFDKHHVIRGLIAARTGEAAIRQMAAIAASEEWRHAATGLAGAWLLDHFAAFRLATLFIDRLPSEEALERMGFRQEERGANAWLVVPADDGVFVGASGQGGIQCAHPVQVLLDLKGHPERSAEAAAHLRESWSKGRGDAR